MSRGEIWWADLRAPTASEPGYRRPVLIVQADRFNRSRISTAVAAVLTSNLRLKDAPGNVLVRRRAAGLSKDCVINVSQLFTVDRSFLDGLCGQLSSELMKAVDQGLRLVLAL